MTKTVRWRKASHSTEGSSCVEVVNTLDQLRDSKNPTGPVLHGDITVLIQAIQTDDFDQR